MTVSCSTTLCHIVRMRQMPRHGMPAPCRSPEAPALMTVETSRQKREIDERKKTTTKGPIIRRRRNLPGDELKYR